MRFIVLLIACASSIGIAPYRALAGDADSLLLTGIRLVHQERFEEALALFDQVIAAAPERPVGYFFKAGTYANLSADYRNLSFSNLFDHYVNKAIAVGQALNKSGRATAEDIFYYGGALGYRGIYRSFYGDWLGAFKDAVRGKSVLEQAFRMDSSFYDIYYGLGIYDYWRSAKTKILSWLPFFPDRRNQGIKRIYLAIEKGRFVRDEAKYALLRIYDNEKDYQSVLTLWENYLKQINPDDPFALYYVGRASANLGRYEEAIKIFERLLDIFISSPYYDPASELDVYYNLGVFYYRWQKPKEAVRYLSLARDIAQSMPHRKDVEEAIENSEDYYRKALASLGQN